MNINFSSVAKLPKRKKGKKKVNGLQSSAINKPSILVEMSEIAEESVQFPSNLGTPLNEKEPNVNNIFE